MGSSTLHRCRRSSNERAQSTKTRRVCLFIALVVVIDTSSSCVKAAPFGRPTFRRSIPVGPAPPYQLEDVRRRYPLLLRKILGQIRGGSDDESQAIGVDEISGGGDAKRRRRRRRRKTRSHASEEPEEDVTTATAAADTGDDEGGTAEVQDENGASKSWLESYLSGAGGDDEEAGDNERADGTPGNEADTPAIATTADDADAESGEGTTTESEIDSAEDTQQTGHKRRRRRRRRRRGAATATVSAEESEADVHQADTSEGEDKQTMYPVPVETSDEVPAMEVDPSAEGGGRVKMRRRRRRRIRANAGIHQSEMVGEEETAPSVEENGRDDGSDADVSESQADSQNSSSHDDDDNENSEIILADADTSSIPNQDLAADVDISPEVEVTSVSDAEDTKEESNVSSAEIADEDVGEEEATVSDVNDDDDDDDDDESNDEESNNSQQDEEDDEDDSSDGTSEQSDSGVDGGEDTDSGSSEASTTKSEGKDTDSESATSESTSDESSETSGVESNNDESEEAETENEEADSDTSKEDEEEQREEIAESDKEDTVEVADSSPAEESSDDDDESSIDNDEEASSDAAAPIGDDVLKTEEIEEEEVEEDTSLVADVTEPDLEVSDAESAEKASDDTSLDTSVEGTVGDDEEEDNSTKITVSVVTWNLAEASPSEDEARFIRRFRKAHPSLSPQENRKGSDIVLIGGQETEDIKPRRAEGSRSRELRRLMIKMLGKEYVPIAIHSLGGVQFGLCVRREILEEIEICHVADVTCGIGNVFHNKGAICAYVQMKARNKQGNEGEAGEESSTKRQKSVKMLFVAAHMAAHVKNVDARNEDFWRIASEFEAQAPPRFLRPKSPREQALVNAEDSGGSHLMDSMDHVFFCGDLNYRIDLPREITEYTVMKIEECLQRGEERKADELRLSLLRHDQLSRVMSEGAAFPGFAEGKITFPPTFKFDKGTKSYDKSHKQRVPAFTDRILFKPFGVRVLEYRSEVDATHSDHRPVTGTFLVDIEGKKLPEQSRRRQKPKKRSRRKRPRSEVDQ